MNSRHIETPGSSKGERGEREPHGLSGVLVLDKPAGITSMTAVSMVRRLAGGTKTGHAGTLDPLATGVLVIALGKATKCIDRLMATDKRYETTIDLTAFTTTDDLEGQRTEVAVKRPPTVGEVRETLKRFVGRVLQRPPQFSAVKVDGRRAYKLARKGQAVELPQREVTVHSIELVRYEWPQADLLIHCEKGFYVRSLARELGEAMGTGGHCVYIRRTAVGPFTLRIARSIQDLPSPLTNADLLDLPAAMELLESAAA